VYAFSYYEAAGGGRVEPRYFLNNVQDFAKRDDLVDDGPGKPAGTWGLSKAQSTRFPGGGAGK
jgi:hypothetical protein